jgi:hypothetical protein
MWAKAGLFLLMVSNAAAQIAPGPGGGGFPPDEDPRYFPVGVFAEGKSDDGDFRARWYASRLRALREPALSENTSANAESMYRFTWLRAFHRPIAIRIIVHSNGTGTLTAKVSDGMGGYEPGNLITNSTREIDVKKIRHLRELLRTLDFWNMPPEPALNDKVAELDGAQWIFEASNKGNCHVIDRWSPRTGPVRELGLYMMRKLGQLDIPEKLVY